MITHTYEPRVDEHRRLVARHRPKRSRWNPRRYFHFGFGPTAWMEWWMYGCPIGVVGHGPFAGHRWTLDWTTRRQHGFATQEGSVTIRTVDMCDDCLNRYRQLRKEMEAQCVHPKPPKYTKIINGEAVPVNADGDPIAPTAPRAAP